MTSPDNSTKLKQTIKTRAEEKIQDVQWLTVTEGKSHTLMKFGGQGEYTLVQALLD